MMQLTDPNWWAISLEPRDQIPGGGKLDTAGFKAVDAVEVTAGAAAISATSIPITAATGGSGSGDTLIPSNTTITFGGAKFATLTAAFKKGDTTMTVAPLAVAIAAADKATYFGMGVIPVPSGILVGRTQADIDTNGMFKLATAANIATLVEVYLTAFSQPDLSRTNDITLTRPGFVVKQNRLPGWTTLDAAVQAKIRQVYTCTIGV